MVMTAPPREGKKRGSESTEMGAAAGKGDDGCVGDEYVYLST